MTQQHDFKQRVRARMLKTGERYSAARAQILAALQSSERSRSGSNPASSTDAPPYTCDLGVCRDTGAVRNMLAALGVRDPRGGRPLSEALLTGLAGGVGFLYIVFEYRDTPPLLSVLMRYDTSADQFALGGLARLGLGLRVHETTSAAKAEKHLATALSAGRPVLCVVDAAGLFPSSSTRALVGMAPTIVVVTGATGDAIEIDAGRGRLLQLSRSDFAAARTACRKSRHRLAEITAPHAPVDLPRAVDEAIGACLHRYEHAPYKGFASNFGFAGMEKWARLLTDERDPKGWPRLFPEGPAACLGLRRVYEGIEYEMTGPVGGRPLYARFLREAAEICGHAPYERAAGTFAAAGDTWADISSFVASCGVSAVQTGCELLDSYAELLDAQADRGERGVPPQAQDYGVAAADLDRDRARVLYAKLATLVRRAIDAERAAVAALREARATRV